MKQLTNLLWLDLSWLALASRLCCVLKPNWHIDVKRNTDAAGTSATPPPPAPDAAAAAAGFASRPLVAALASAWTAGICGDKHKPSTFH
jgi:hypothetical protein